MVLVRCMIVRKDALPYKYVLEYYNANIANKSVQREGMYVSLFFSLSYSPSREQHYDVSD